MMNKVLEPYNIDKYGFTMFTFKLVATDLS